MHGFIELLRSRWAKVAWLDALLKSGLLFAVLALAWLAVARLFGTTNAAAAGGPRTVGGLLRAALQGGLLWGSVTAAGVLVYRTVRAAKTGRFPDEDRAERAARR